MFFMQKPKFNTKELKKPRSMLADPNYTVLQDAKGFSPFEVNGPNLLDVKMSTRPDDIKVIASGLTFLDALKLLTSLNKMADDTNVSLEPDVKCVEPTHTGTQTGPEELER